MKNNASSLFTLVISCLAAAPATCLGTLIASESFNYSLDGYTAGLEGKAGGTGFGAEVWKEFGSNANNGIFTETLTVGSDAAPTANGPHARAQLSTAGAGIGRNLATTVGTDGTQAWLSYRIQNNNTDASESFAVVFTTLSEARRVIMGATSGVGGQSSTDGQFDLAFNPSGANQDYATRDQANHFEVLRFDFGAGNNDTVTLFQDPTTATDFFGTGHAQLTGIDATFDGIAFTATGATLRWDEIRIGTTLADVTVGVVPEPTTVALVGLGLLGLAFRRRK